MGLSCAFGEREAIPEGFTTTGARPLAEEHPAVKRPDQQMTPVEQIAPVEQKAGRPVAARSKGG